MKNDTFANIAKNGIGGRSELLYQPEPMKFDKKISKLEKSTQEPIKTAAKISTPEELSTELNKMKRRYASFLEEHAPICSDVSKRIPIQEFLCDGEVVTIPHYGGPVGNAVKIYETEFVLDKFDSKAVYICFLGADYKASIYINDVCVGIHEGFFSPFEYEITERVRAGVNKLKVVLENDFIYMGNAFAHGEATEGDKLYAATGLGWDDPEVGWHHCPPGMGIYNDVFVEVRNRVNLTDLYVRPMPENSAAEIWTEVKNADYTTKEIEFNISIYGLNFEEAVIENYRYIPSTVKTVGLGDSLTEAAVKDILGKGMPMPLKNGSNLYKIPVTMNNFKLWELDSPYLYQLQLEVWHDGKLMDKKCCNFGMRSFTQDVENKPYGMYYLNGKKIRLRGANTMGFEQQDVMQNDFCQLIDDILLAKLCNMNFLRLTQRPVQKEVYDYCDKLGLMTQTDLPLFGCMRRTKLAEGVRQAEEMEKLIRSHPCNVVVSYINEPFPNANNQPHRHMSRDELERFFDACDIAVRLHNPDRVIKHVDGDYDPPSKTMPDNHCYPMWYNGHGIDIGRLHKGYWLDIKPDWYCGCGEYGAEGLDFADVMREEYPSEWLSEPFNPNNIVNAQTGNFYRFFFDKGDSLEDWVNKSQSYQAFATKMMTEAFRRNPKMISFAIHLFIDAWPSGWMKTIMDCRRTPKPAYFAYRNALEPIMLSLRTDRFTYYEGEKISVECYVCNDTFKSEKYKVIYELDGMRAETNAEITSCDVTYVSNAEFVIDEVSDREECILKAILLDEKDNVVTWNSLKIEVFSAVEVKENPNTEIIFDLQPGEYEIAGETVKVKECGMLPLHFASRKTGHAAVKDFNEKDFSYWYDEKVDMITPILRNTFIADGFVPILLSGNTDDEGNWIEMLVCGEKLYNGKRYIICNVDLRQENPVAKRFLKQLYEL